MRKQKNIGQNLKKESKMDLDLRLCSIEAIDKDGTIHTIGLGEDIFTKHIGWYDFTSQDFLSTEVMRGLFKEDSILAYSNDQKEEYGNIRKMRIIGKIKKKENLYEREKE